MFESIKYGAIHFDKLSPMTEKLKTGQILSLFVE